MMHETQLTNSDIQKIYNRFPLDVAAICYKYPVDVLNALEFLDKLPLPNNYNPHTIEVYYADTFTPQIFITDGKLQDYSPPPEQPKDHNCISVMIDDDWAYIQIESKVLLNRLGGAMLPDIFVDPEKLLNSVLTEEVYD